LRFYALGSVSTHRTAIVVFRHVNHASIEVTGTGTSLSASADSMRCGVHPEIVP
jgi:hypothetical protein